jgi:Domain of unknown function (DUF1833)
VRTLSLQAIASANSPQTGGVWLWLIEVVHPDLDEPYRFVNNTQDVASLGQTWTAFPVQLTLAVDDGQTNPSFEIKFDNVDRTLIDVVRGLTSAPRFNVYLVLYPSPNIAEATFEDMQAIDISFDAQSVSARLVSGDLLNAPYPGDSYTPDQFPAIFA